MIIWLQKSASIQPRTDRLKLMIVLINNFRLAEKALQVRFAAVYKLCIDAEARDAALQIAGAAPEPGLDPVE